MFASTLPWSPVPLAIAAILFAFSTMIAWAYYGLKAFTYLAGEGRWQDLGFKFFFCLFVVVGASVNLGAITDLSDALVFVVAIPNLVGLYLMAPIVRRHVRNNQEFAARLGPVRTTDLVLHSDCRSPEQLVATILSRSTLTEKPDSTTI